MRRLKEFKNSALLTMTSLLLLCSQVMGQIPTRQTYTVRGEILSLIDGLPLPNIEVYLKGTNYSAISDSNGVFQIKGVPAGTYDIVAKYPDFDATILKDVVVPPPARKSYVFNLEPVAATRSLPYVDRPAPDTLGSLQGEITIRIDAYSKDLERGYLQLRATVVGDLRQGYLYPQEWKVLPVDDQRFRFRFYLPKGKRYRLFLIWREPKDAYTVDRIVDVVRSEKDPSSAIVFDLRTQSMYTGIHYQVELSSLLQ